MSSTTLTHMQPDAARQSFDLSPMLDGFETFAAWVVSGVMLDAIRREHGAGLIDGQEHQTERQRLTTWADSDGQLWGQFSTRQAGEDWQHCQTFRIVHGLDGQGVPARAQDLRISGAFTGSRYLAVAESPGAWSPVVLADPFASAYAGLAYLDALGTSNSRRYLVQVTGDVLR